jgi:hypothetical protein
MKTNIQISCALAAAAMALAGPAVAVNSATATVTGFSFTLYDLDPSDGITPDLTLANPYSQSYARVYSASESANDSDGQPGSFVPTSAASALAFGYAEATTGNGAATAMGHVSGPAYGGSGSFYSQAVGTQYGFTLTPWTGLRLTLTFDGTASTGPALSSNNLYANASGVLQVGVSDGGNGYEYHYGQRSAYAGCNWDGSACAGESNSFSGTVSLTYANLSGDSVAGWLYGYAYAQGTSAVPVPEPQTYLILLAGLAGVGAVVRRRSAD